MLRTRTPKQPEDMAAKSADIPLEGKVVIATPPRYFWRKIRATLSVTFLLVASLALAVATSGTASGSPCPDGDCAGYHFANSVNYQFEYQQNSYYCGPASTRIALSAREVYFSQDDLASALGTTENGTDSISGNIAPVLNRHTGGWYAGKLVDDPPSQAQRDLLRFDVRYDIDRGYALIANVWSGWGPSGWTNEDEGYWWSYPQNPWPMVKHYVAIVGYTNDGDLVRIADPAGYVSGHRIPRSYWVSLSDLAVWIGGSAGYAA